MFYIGILRFVCTIGVDAIESAYVELEAPNTRSVSVSERRQNDVRRGMSSFASIHVTPRTLFKKPRGGSDPTPPPPPPGGRGLRSGERPRRWGTQITYCRDQIIYCRIRKKWRVSTYPMVWSALWDPSHFCGARPVLWNTRSFIWSVLSANNSCPRRCGTSENTYCRVRSASDVCPRVDPISQKSRFMQRGSSLMDV